MDQLDVVAGDKAEGMISKRQRVELSTGKGDLR